MDKAELAANLRAMVDELETKAQPEKEPYSVMSDEIYETLERDGFQVGNLAAGLHHRGFRIIKASDELIEADDPLRAFAGAFKKMNYSYDMYGLYTALKKDGHILATRRRD